MGRKEIKVEEASDEEEIEGNSSDEYDDETDSDSDSDSDSGDSDDDEESEDSDDHGQYHGTRSDFTKFKRNIPGLDKELLDCEEFVRSSIYEVVAWKDPLQSALWFSVLFLFFFLTLVSDYSLLTLMSYLIMLQLLTTRVSMRIAPVLSGVGVLGPNFDPKIFALKRQAFTSDELQKFSQGVASIFFGWADEWNEALIASDSRKIFKVFSIALVSAIIGKLLPIELILFLVFILSFVLPAIYERQQDRIDDLIEIATDKFDEAWDNMNERLDPILSKIRGQSI